MSSIFEQIVVRTSSEEEIRLGLAGVNAFLAVRQKAANRALVTAAYDYAKANNHSQYMKGDVRVSEEYTFPNQIIDAHYVVDAMFSRDPRVISIQKPTKVGCNGLMVEIAVKMTTHPDDGFVVDPANVRFITGMSNVTWQNDMQDFVPACFKDQVFHHGQLSHSNLQDLKNALIFIDEIDTGDKEGQVLHRTLKEAGVLDIAHMQENNNRFVFVSATMVKELHDLYKWGEHHESYKMTIPEDYIGSMDFLGLGIIQEWYALNTAQAADKWIDTDILGNYGSDFRVHLVRVNNKTRDVIQNACIKKGVTFCNNTSVDRLSKDNEERFFRRRLTNHVVIAIKGFWRRADLIPNKWKLRIGATHEHYTKKVDNNVQAQGLPGRMNGYWRAIVESGHKTGPYRTSVRAIQEYHATYENPFGENSYVSAGFKKVNGRVLKAQPTMISVRNIANLHLPVRPVQNLAPELQVEPVGPSVPPTVQSRPEIKFRIYYDEVTARNACKLLKYNFRATTLVSPDGFKQTALGSKAKVCSLADVVDKIKSPSASNVYTQTGKQHRNHYPCYVNVNDANTLRYVIVIPPSAESQLPQLDARFPPIAYVV
jgi:hypothetical protein